MSITLESFAQQVREYLQADPGPAGREKARLLLQEVLVDPEFVAEYVKDDYPQRTVLHHDEALGFAILSHVYHVKRETPPHDHGISWAIYGQVAGESLIHDWAVVDPAAAGKPGKVRRNGARSLTPGTAITYQEGEIHSPSREGPAKLIRIEGLHVQETSRFEWQAV